MEDWMKGRDGGLDERFEMAKGDGTEDIRGQSIYGDEFK